MEVRTVLHVGDKVHLTPSKARKTVRDSLKAQYPGVTGIIVTDTHHEADESSGEPYTQFVATGEVA